MEEERIMTLHPDGKAGVNLLKRRYDIIKDTLLEILEKDGQMTFESLADRTVEAVEKDFDGKPLWYIVTVKLDLEARGIIERIPKTSPHQLRLSKPLATN